MANESRIFYGNIIKNASVVTASTETTGFEVEYTYDEIPSTVHRTTVITESTITFDFGSATAIEGVAVLNHSNMDTTLKWESSTDNFSTTSETQDLTTLTRTVKTENNAGVIEDVTRRDSHYQGSWNRRYYRLRYQASAGTYMEIGQIFIFTGNYLFAKNFVWNYQAGREKQFLQTTSINGSTFRRRDFSREMYDLQFTGITTAQKNKLVREASEYRKCVFLDGISGDLFYGWIETSNILHARSDNWNGKVVFTESL